MNVMTQPIGELSDRMREIFGHVVEAYLERGLPIGSKALTGTISLSPASIRGVMQELEERRRAGRAVYAPALVALQALRRP